MENSNKYVLITGATSGIGYELAKLFAKDHYNLVLVARTEEELHRTAAELKQQGVEVKTFSKDLFKKEAAFELYEEVRAAGIDIDILVNDAGQGLYGEFIDTDLNRELDIIQLNISSLVVLTKLFVKDLVVKGEGRILNLASVASRIPGPLQAVYHATKAFVLSFSEAIRNELKDTGVTVTALMPGATDTDFFAKADMLNAKNVAEGKLDDAAKVAQDGYDALMKGDDKVVSGFKNKAMVGMSHITPDPVLAEQLHQMQAPVDEDK